MPEERKDINAIDDSTARRIASLYAPLALQSFKMFLNSFFASRQDVADFMGTSFKSSVVGEAIKTSLETYDLEGFIKDSVEGRIKELADKDNGSNEDEEDDEKVAEQDDENDEDKDKDKFFESKDYKSFIKENLKDINVEEATPIRMRRPLQPVKSKALGFIKPEER